MEIHNIMEELVAARIDELIREDRESGTPRYSAEPECRIDTVCYVLNRLSPRYVSSGRGYAHLTEELAQDQQLLVDVVRLAHEGLHRVSAVRRNFYGSQVPAHLEGPCFNFPTIKGRLLDGSTFSPVSGVSVLLTSSGASVAMFDPRWSNPYTIPSQAPGTFIFWPASLTAKMAGEEREFSFELVVDEPSYEPMHHFLTVPLKSDEHANPVFSLERDYHLPDLYLFSR